MFAAIGLKKVKLHELSKHYNLFHLIKKTFTLQ